MGVSQNRGVYPPKWMMVKIMVPNPMNKWMIWGGYSTPILGNIQNGKKTASWNVFVFKSWAWIPRP